MNRRPRRFLVPIAALVTAVGGIAAASALAQSDPTPTAPLGVWCPQQTNPSLGQAVTCKVVADPDWVPPTTATPPTTTTSSSTTTTVPTTTTTTVPPVTTTTVSPAPAVGSEEWKATTGLTSPVGSLTVVNSSFSTTADNQVIDGKRITGDLVVNNANVTVTNTRILGVVRGSDLRGLTLRNVDLGLDACPKSTNGGTRLINAGNYTVENSRLHHNGADLVNLAAGNVTYRNSWLGNTCYYSGDHLDAIQMYNPGQNVTLLVERSFLDSRAANVNALGNGAVFIADNPGAGSRFVLKNNLFAGGNYTTSFYDSSNFEVRDNKYVAGAYRYGPCSSTGTITFTGNTLDNGTPVSC